MITLFKYKIKCVIRHLFYKEHLSYLPVQIQANDFKKSTIDFLQRSDIWQEQVRDDYKELIELTLTVLGMPPTVIHWRAPGSVHRARWMAKLIYAIKIYLFHDQEMIPLSNNEKVQLERFVHFGALIYAKSWFSAPLATEAPAQDLQLWYNLKDYEQIDRQIATTAKKVLENHLWYLSDELVGLALFSDNVSTEEKSALLAGSLRKATVRKVRGDISVMKKEPQLGDFASTRTTQICRRFNIDPSFLQLPPDVWNDNDKYVEGKKRISKLRVVNDTAERGVKLFQEYNLALSHDEEETQLILQVVEANRKIVPTQVTKTSAVKALTVPVFKC